MSCPNNALLEFSRILFDDLKLIPGFLVQLNVKKTKCINKYVFETRKS